MKLNAKSGAAIAATAAALLMSGTVTAMADNHGAEAKGHCIGANGCGGKGACKTANNECGGKNKCKGQGFVEMTKAECEAAMKANKDEKIKISFEEPKK